MLSVLSLQTFVNPNHFVLIPDFLHNSTYMYISTPICLVYPLSTESSLPADILSLSLTLSLCYHLSLFLFLFLFLFLSFSVSVSLSLSLSISFCLTHTHT